MVSDNSLLLDTTPIQPFRLILNDRWICIDLSRNSTKRTLCMTEIMVHERITKGTDN